MTLQGLRALLPLLAIAAGTIAVLLLAAFRAGHRAAWGGAVCTLALAASFAAWAMGTTPRQVTPVLVMDRYALFFIVLFSLAGLAVAAVSHAYLERKEERREEYYILLLLFILGGCVLSAGSHFVSFFLGLELMSVSLYVLISYPYDSRISLEAGLKYLVLSGASSASLLFGMALLYYSFGTMEFAGLGASSFSAAGRSDFGWPPVLFGTGMILAGAGFKMGVVPFHTWVPDIFEGAPAPVAALAATVSKGAVLSLLFRYLLVAEGYALPSLLMALAMVAIASMLVGNLLALLQDNVKRILAYSSISHMGFLMVALLSGAESAAGPLIYYLTAYFVTMLGAFAVVSGLSGGGRDADGIEEYRGLFWRRPWLAAAFSACLFSLAGIPLTGGFLGKFLILAAAVRVGIWIPAVVLAVSSAIGLYYYLRIVAAMFSRAPDGSVEAGEPPGFPAGGKIALAGLTFLLFWLGVHPLPLIRLIRFALGAPQF